MRRLARRGFLQSSLLPLFGFYPWECFACRTKKMVRARGGRTFHRIWDDSWLESFEPVDNPSDEELSSAASTFEEDSSPEKARSPAVPPADA